MPSITARSSLVSLRGVASPPLRLGCGRELRRRCTLKLKHFVDRGDCTQRAARPRRSQPGGARHGHLPSTPRGVRGPCILQGEPVGEFNENAYQARKEASCNRNTNSIPKGDATGTTKQLSVLNWSTYPEKLRYSTAVHIR